LPAVKALNEQTFGHSKFPLQYPMRALEAAVLPVSRCQRVVRETPACNTGPCDK
jgi:hypothetical protein